MTKISNKLKVYLYSCVILSIIAMLVSSICYITAFDTSEGYFYAKAPLPYVFIVLCVLAVVWFASSLFTVPKNELNGASPTTVTVNIASAPLFACSATLGIIMTVSYFVLIFHGQNFFTELFPSYKINHSLLLLVAGIFLLVSAAYYAVLWFNQDRHGEINALIGFSLPLGALLLIAVTYFDLHTTMNSPVKMSFQIAMIAFMIFSMYELRIALGKPKPRAYFFSAMVTVLLTGTASFPQILAFIFGKLTNTAYLLYSIFALCVFIYVLARLCIFVSARSLLERIADQTPSELESAEDEVEPSEDKDPDSDTERSDLPEQD